MVADSRSMSKAGRRVPLVMAFFAIILVLLCLPGRTFARKTTRLNIAKQLFVPKPRDNYRNFAANNRNQLEATFSTLFLGYKTVISSQDMDMCAFEPSCSVYAIECIHHEKNKVVAVMKISDRLMRCHPLDTKGGYLVNPKTGKKLDPVEN